MVVKPLQIFPNISHGILLKLTQKCSKVILSKVKLTKHLQSNMNIVSGPTAERQDITNLRFGDNYVGEHMVWTAIVEPDFPDAVNVDSLKQDFDLVPMVIGLDESINIKTGVYRTMDTDHANIMFIKQLDN